MFLDVSKSLVAKVTPTWFYCLGKDTPQVGDIFRLGGKCHLHLFPVLFTSAYRAHLAGSHLDPEPTILGHGLQVYIIVFDL